MQKLIPYQQALRLHDLSVRVAQLQDALGALQAQFVHHRETLDTACQFADIPTNGEVSLRIEAGPDDEGMIVVEWPDPPKPEKPKEAGHADTD